MISTNICLLGMLISLTAVGGCSFGPKTSVVATEVSNGQIVILRKGNSAYGAFVPLSQKMSSDRLVFRWYYRTDGKGTFLKSQAGKYRTGVSLGVPDGSVPYLMAKFGPFRVGWSGKEDGQGHIYYSHFEGEVVAPVDVKLCVTDETNIERIDATDPRWVYKGSPSDPGTRNRGQRGHIPANTGDSSRY